MTKQDIDIITVLIKDYVKELIDGWGLSDTEKTLVSFEETYLPYTKYSGNQSIDHIVFRKFLRHFDPENIEDGIVAGIIDKLDATTIPIRIVGKHGETTIKFYCNSKPNDPDLPIEPETPQEEYTIANGILKCISTDHVENGVLYLSRGEVKDGILIL